MDWPKGKDFEKSPEEKVTHAEETPLCNKMPVNEKKYALFNDELWESYGGGRLLCGVLDDELQRLLKKNVN